MIDLAKLFIATLPAILTATASLIQSLRNKNKIASHDDDIKQLKNGHGEKTNAASA